MFIFCVKKRGGDIKIPITSLNIYKRVDIGMDKRKFFTRNDEHRREIKQIKLYKALSGFHLNNEGCCV